MHFIRTTIAVVATALAACQAGADPRREPPPGRDVNPNVVLREHMRDNYDLARAIEVLLLRGQLAGAKSLARLIEIAPVPPGTSAWPEYAVAVRARAADLIAAGSLDEALRQQAQLAAACGGCHRAAGASPEFATTPDLPPDADTVEARMARHRWAAERLWDGAIGGTDASWSAGLDVLATAPLAWPGLSDRAGFAHQLRERADSARRTAATDLADRTRDHGEILVICAACHAADNPK